jgi:hypothetical protein
MDALELLRAAENPAAMHWSKFGVWSGLCLRFVRLHDAQAGAGTPLARSVERVERIERALEAAEAATTAAPQVSLPVGFDVAAAFAAVDAAAPAVAPAVAALIEQLAAERPAAEILGEAAGPETPALYTLNPALLWRESPLVVYLLFRAAFRRGRREWLRAWSVARGDAEFLLAKAAHDEGAYDARLPATAGQVRYAEAFLALAPDPARQSAVRRWASSGSPVGANCT